MFAPEFAGKKFIFQKATIYCLKVKQRRWNNLPDVVVDPGLEAEIKFCYDVWVYYCAVGCLLLKSSQYLKISKH